MTNARAKIEGKFKAARDVHFQCEGKFTSCSKKAKFLVEIANGSSSYTLERGFGDPNEAVTFYGELGCGPNQKKRLTMVDGKTVTILARTK